MKSLLVLLLVSLALFADDEHRAYFEQFIYLEHSNQPDPDFPPSVFFQYLTDSQGNGGDRVPIDGGRQYVSFETLVFLLEDGTHKTLYTEYVYRNPSDIFGAVNGCKEIVGTWDVPGEQLELYDENGNIFAVGDKALFDGLEGVNLVYKRGLVSPEVEGKFAEMDFFSYSQQGIDDSSCPAGF